MSDDELLQYLVIIIFLGSLKGILSWKDLKSERIWDGWRIGMMPGGEQG